MTTAKYSFPEAAGRAYYEQFGIFPSEAAGLRSVALVDGVLIGLYDGREARLDTDGGRWSTVCETHGMICAHPTLALVKAHAKAPTGWCEECDDPERFAASGGILSS